MKINASHKLLFTTLIVVFLSLFSGLIINLLTNDNNFSQWLKDNNIGTHELVIGVILTLIALLFFTYISVKNTHNSEQKTSNNIKQDGKDNIAIQHIKDSSITINWFAQKEPQILQDIEPDVKRFYDSLRERYLKRYESKLDGRFEITLEVSENWDGEHTKQFTGEYEGKGQISEAFEYIRSAFEKQGRLLIVGNPGVGKTVLLLKLALELLDKADIGKKEAFPVIFNLASWSDEYEKFDDWLISVLNSGEGLSKDFARELLRDERIIFLLDGLDELARNESEEEAAKKRAECLTSLNDYLDRGKKVVICCRVKEFEKMQALTGRSAPVSAKVKINDLSEAEILNELMKAQRNEMDRVAASNILKILEKGENDQFLKVLSTPFYFTTALEVFDKQILKEKSFPKKNREVEDYLRKKFVEKKLAIIFILSTFKEKQIFRWLKWLAKYMKKRQTILFELDSLQPIYLVKFRNYRFLIKLLFGISQALTFSLLGIVLMTSFDFSVLLVFPLSLMGLMLGVLSTPVHPLIITRDIVKWDFKNIAKWQTFKEGLFLGLRNGLFQGIVIGFAFIMVSSSFIHFDLEPLNNLSLSFISGFMYGLISGLGSRFFSFTCWVSKVTKRFVKIESPYQRLNSGIKGELLEYLFLGVWGTLSLFIALVGFNSSITGSLVIIIVLCFGILRIIDAVLVGLFSTALFEHIIVRFCYYFEGAIPLKYATFLNYAAEAGILEKDGGHWRFRHQNLQDYFANLDE